ncbi:uncharacterized protein DNG_08125 [Cephalotrichum gorgonifer]|uniref:Nephrocystin 3-like N-terminal domain-containing protein n=1 Tax=Cephalotrichum gorgonifer TaxID=2041049 RepID=A0AAE8N5H0_9PEZI|nr:uncharacterized protein DNG_08125 [Cephalotrichum gorgonifer]
MSSVPEPSRSKKRDKFKAIFSPKYKVSVVSKKEIPSPNATTSPTIPPPIHGEEEGASADTDAINHQLPAVLVPGDSSGAGGTSGNPASAASAQITLPNGGGEPGALQHHGSAPEHSSSTRVEYCSSWGTLWRLALSGLPKEEQAIINNVLRDGNQGSNPATTTIDALQGVLENKKTVYEQKAWRYQFNGKTRRPRDDFANILSWLQKFKEVVDVAVSYDPVHAALPWAGIRFFIQALVAVEEQKSLILVGLEKVSQLSFRLSVYQRIYLHENSPLDEEVLSHFHEAVVAQCRKMLSFLALALGLSDKNAISRGIQGVFNPQKVSSFVENLEKGEKELAMEASICHDTILVNMNTMQRADYHRLQTLLRKDIDLIAADLHHVWARGNSRDSAEALQWICTIPHETDHLENRQGRVEDTGEWLLNHQGFKDWMRSEASSTFWLHGIPGSGKTKLSSKVIDHILQGTKTSSHGATLAYFYCSRNQADHHNSGTVLRSLVRQLSADRQDSAIVRFIFNMWKEQQNLGFPMKELPVEEAIILLKKLVLVYSSCTIVIDGLDECTEGTRDGLIDVINDLVSEPKSLVRVFIASRNERDITGSFSAGRNHQISASDNQDDIVQFVQSKLRDTRNPWFKEKMPDDVRVRILQKFTQKSEGMFQWASLLIDGLLRLSRGKDIIEYLDTLPRGLENAYRQTYKEIQEREGSAPVIAYRTFQWILFSWRPLTTRELTTAVCQDPDEPGCSPVDPDIDMDFIMDACRNLVTVSQDGNVRFSHLSVNEYFESQYWSSSQGNGFLGLACLQILTDPQGLEIPPPATLTLVREELGSYYYGWFAHLKEFDGGPDPESSPLWKVLNLFLGKPMDSSKYYQHWCRQAQSHLSPIAGVRFKSLRYSLEPITTPIFAVFLLGLSGLSRRWLSSADLDPTMVNAHSESLIHLAAISGDTSLCRNLLFHHSNSNVADSMGITPLERAIQDENKAMVELLIESGDAAINGPSGELYGSLLCAAVSTLNVDIVRLLLHHGADPNPPAGLFGTPIQAAARLGELPLVMELLESGADPRIASDRFKTAVQAAKHAQSEEIALYLKKLNPDGSYDDVEEQVHQIAMRRYRDGSYRKSPFAYHLRRTARHGWGLEIAGSDTRQRLFKLFRPPFELMSDMTLQEARAVGREQMAWVMVNIYDVRFFQSVALNRDHWKHAGIVGLIKEHFVFTQFEQGDPGWDEAENYAGCYSIDLDDSALLPYVSIIHPGSGKLKVCAIGL